jgi:uncharacterized protein (UPF0147 family)
MKSKNETKTRETIPLIDTVKYDTPEPENLRLNAEASGKKVNQKHM